MPEPECELTLSGEHVYSRPPLPGTDLGFSCACGRVDGALQTEQPPPPVSPPSDYVPGDRAVAFRYLAAAHAKGRWTQKYIISNFIFDQSPEWVPSHALQSTSVPTGDRDRYIGTSGDRRARELAEAGVIDRRHVGQFAEYRWPQRFRQ